MRSSLCLFKKSAILQTRDTIIASCRVAKEGKFYRNTLMCVLRVEKFVKGKFPSPSVLFCFLQLHGTVYVILLFLSFISGPPFFFFFFVFSCPVYCLFHKLSNQAVRCVLLQNETQWYTKSKVSIKLQVLQLHYIKKPHSRTEIEFLFVSWCI
jgi:hypothetical protein